MKTLQLKPVIESIEGGYQAKASLYQDNFHCATESFNTIQLTIATGSPGLINHRKAIKL